MNLTITAEQLIANLPTPAALRQAAKVYSRIENEVFGSDTISYTENYTNDNTYDRYFFENGSGYELTILFKDASLETLIFEYDSESSASTYGKPEDPSVDEVFLQLPNPYDKVIRDSSLFWSWDQSNGLKKVYATAAIWYNLISEKWDYSDLNENNSLNGGLKPLLSAISVQKLLSFYEKQKKLSLESGTVKEITAIFDSCFKH